MITTKHIVVMAVIFVFITGCANRSQNVTSTTLQEVTPSSTISVSPSQKAPVATSSPTSSPTDTPLSPTATASPTPIPTIAGLSLPVPDPRFFDTKQIGDANPASAILRFVKSIKETGIAITSDQVNNELEFYEFKDTDNNPFVIAAFRLDPEPANQGEMLEGVFPLLIYDSGFSDQPSWRTATMRDLADKNGIQIGTSITTGMRDDPGYWQTAGSEFSVLVPDEEFLEVSTKYGQKHGIGLVDHPEKADWAAKFARDHQMTLRILHGFWIKDVPPQFADASSADVEEYMRQRVERLLQYAEKGKRTEITFVNEPFHEGGSLDRSIFYQRFGEDWVKKAYILFYESAQSKGLVVGKDIILMYSEDGIDLPNRESSAVYKYLKQLKIAIARDLEINEDQVPLDVVMQYHMHADKENERGWDSLWTGELDPDKVISHLNQFGGIGNVHLGEVDVSGTEDLNLLAEAEGMVVEACLQSKSCKSIIFWTTLDLGDNNPGLFTKEKYDAQQPYWTIMRILFENLLVHTNIS